MIGFLFWSIDSRWVLALATSAEETSHERESRKCNHVMQDFRTEFTSGSAIEHHIAPFRARASNSRMRCSGPTTAHPRQRQNDIPARSVACHVIRPWMQIEQWIYPALRVVVLRISEKLSCYRKSFGFLYLLGTRTDFIRTQGSSRRKLHEYECTQPAWQILRWTRWLRLTP